MNGLVGTTISSSSSDYEVEAELCRCRFGVVLQCHKKLTNETVVLKVFKNILGTEYAKQEVAMLETLKGAGAKDFNIVTLKDAFMFDGRNCLEFEKLDVSLEDYMKEKSLSLKEIRWILYQLVQALNFLGSRKIVHAAVKPSHIMMVDHLRQPLKIKLIDFGSASINSEKVMGNFLEGSWYKAPEILERVPYDQSADMWALGSVAAEMLTGFVLFSGRNINGLVSPEAAAEDAEAEECDLKAFIDLLTKMLPMDPAQRITPGEALEHPFLTLSHLDRIQHHDYVELSTELMEASDMRNSEEEGCSTSILAKESRIDSDDNRPRTEKRWSNNLAKLFGLFLVFAILVLFASAVCFLLSVFTGSGSHSLFTGKNISQLDGNKTLILLEFLHDPGNSGLALHLRQIRRKLVKFTSPPSGVQPMPTNPWLEIVCSVIVKMCVETTDHCVTLLTLTWQNGFNPEATFLTSSIVLKFTVVL